MSKIVRRVALPPMLSDGGFIDESDSLDAHMDALGSLPAKHRSPQARERLMDALRHTHRFPHVEARVAELADVSRERAAQLLLALDTPEPWEPGPTPGCLLLHFQGGASRREAITGFVRMEIGAPFPEHEHVGTETVLILQGALLDSDGTEHRAGDEIELAPGTTHSFVTCGTIPLLYLVVAMHGVKFGDIYVGPNDPRG